MSISMVKYALDSAKLDNSTEAFVLAILGEYADDRGICFPAVSTVAKRARISVSQTRRVMKKLKRQGELVVIRPGGGVWRSGKGWPNRYLLVSGRPASEVAEIIRRDAAQRAQRTPINATNPGTNAPQPQHPCPTTPALLRQNSGAHASQTANRATSDPSCESPVVAELAKKLSKKPAVTGFGRNQGTYLDIVFILDGMGLKEVEFRSFIAKNADIRNIRKLEAMFKAQHGRIENIGGWCRARLRALGEKFLE